MALICFNGECHPILYGNNTPIGEYELVQRYTDQPGYGGDVLQFKQEENSIFAIHRVWLLDKKHNRQKNLDESHLPKNITNGCINVDKSVYKKILDCCNRVVINK